MGRRIAESRKRQVMEQLNAGKRTTREIASELLLHEEYIRMLLRQLVKEGKVKKVKVGTKNMYIYIPVKRERVE